MICNNSPSKVGDLYGVAGEKRVLRGIHVWELCKRCVLAKSLHLLLDGVLTPDQLAAVDAVQELQT